MSKKIKNCQIWSQRSHILATWLKFLLITVGKLWKIFHQILLAKNHQKMPKFQKSSNLMAESSYFGYMAKISTHDNWQSLKEFLFSFSSQQLPKNAKNSEMDKFNCGALIF